MNEKKIKITTHVFDELVGRTGVIKSEEKYYYVVKLDNENDPLKVLGIAIQKSDVSFI